MTNWTHVNGIFRICCIRCLQRALDFEKIFKNDAELDVNIYENPDKSSVAAFTVSVTGDLSDHESTEDIIDWFHNVCQNHTHHITQAVITVNNEQTNKTQTATLMSDRIKIITFRNDRTEIETRLLIPGSAVRK